MENGAERPEARTAMENGVKRPELEGLATDLVMCSTCSGFMYKKKRTSVAKPSEEVVEVIRDAKKMRALLRAVLLHGPLQEMEPAEATKEQWQVLLQRRTMMETKRCPACSGSIMVEIERCPTCSNSLSEACLMTCSREEGSSEFMSVLRSLVVGKESATEDEAMVADTPLELKLKRARENGKRYSSGLKEKKIKSEDNEGSGSKKAKSSNEMEGSGSKEGKMFLSVETKKQLTRLFTNALDLLEEHADMLKEEENSEPAVGNRKTKMVTRRMDKEDIYAMKNLPPLKPLFYDMYLMTEDIVDRWNAGNAVESMFLEYLQCLYCIKGYAEYQQEVSDDQGDDHKLV